MPLWILSKRTLIFHLVKKKHNCASYLFLGRWLDISNISNFRAPQCFFRYHCYIRALPWLVCTSATLFAFRRTRLARLKASNGILDLWLHPDPSHIAIHCNCLFTRIQSRRMYTASKRSAMPAGFIKTSVQQELCVLGEGTVLGFVW